MKFQEIMLALVPDAFGGSGGIAQYNRDFLSAVAESGHISVVILPRSARRPEITPGNVRQLGPRRGKIQFSLFAMRTVLQHRVHTVFCGHLFMASLAAVIARLKNAKLIVQTHGIEAWPEPTQHQREAVDRADLVLSVSRHTREAVLSWSTVVPERVIVLPNTVRDEFTPGDGSNMRTELGLKGKTVLLTVARMNSRQQYKGHDRVIAVIPQLVALGHDIHYLISGEGDDLQRLEALSREKAVSDRVHFLGLVPLQKLPDLYRAADLYVMPSNGEGFGIAFLEAMASGTQALGLSIGGAKDALADGELGICASQGQFIDAVHLALSAPKPDPNVIAEAARTRFGRHVFAAGVRSVLARLKETA
jgi:phosphatidyl-myo-inositol dimannoside synthase